MRRRGAVAAALLASTLIAVEPAPAFAQAARLVVIKADGLQYDMVDEMVREKNPRTGKSVLPWIEHIFYNGGTRMANFYVRGSSLSGPAWSMLDTGQHLRIRGNVEYDRYTQHGYDYLNFLPYWLANARGRVGDMWGAAVLDELGIPLLVDAYGHNERYQSVQLYQRGSRWMTIGEGVQKRFTTRSPRELVDEWFVGFDMRDILTEQLERELIADLANPEVRYLDYYTTHFDHASHHNRDRTSHRFSLQTLDGTIGRIWTAIGRTPQAAETAIVLVSDHGVNSDERVYSQGFNLVHLLGSAAGGGHHVVTKRRLMVDYAIKGIYPLVPLITTASTESKYLKGKEDDYPTAMLDFDGNERASIHLRDSTLNMLHSLLLELQRRNLSADLRRAASEAFLAIVDRQRAGWQQMSRALKQERGALERAIAHSKATLPAAPERRRNKKAVPETGEQRDARLRQTAHLQDWISEAEDYGAYLAALGRLMGVTKATLASPGAIRIEELIPKHSMGDRNTLSELTNYVVAVSPSGLVLAGDGSLDLERSFSRVDYVALLNDTRMRNNVQPIVSNAPVDFTVVRVPCRVSGVDVTGAESCLWLSSGRTAQALLLGRTDRDRGLLLRYVPVARLASDEQGTIGADGVAWGPGLPLKMWEDENVALPAGVNRESWLGDWHTELEWLQAIHRGAYGNALIGVHEQFAPHDPDVDDSAFDGTLTDQQLLRRFRLRQRTLVEPDLAVVASNHWNFDVRGFNPGGNHGSFLRVSTHATLMLAGGDRTGIPSGLVIDAPYDSLSFVPTVLALTGQADREGRPIPALREKGFTDFPGRIIREIFEAAPPPPSFPSTDDAVSPR